MALIRCPDCNTEVSDKAAACVKCGCPIATAAPIPSSSVGKCPACGSVNTFDAIKEERKTGGFAASLGARLGARVVGNGRFRCKSCRHTWEFGTHF